MKRRSWTLVSLAVLGLALSVAGACAGTHGKSAASAPPTQAKSEASVKPMSSAAAAESGPASSHEGHASSARHGNHGVGVATFDTTKAAALEVLRVKTGHLLVKPLVNGVESGWFIFDTGAGICVISTPHVAEFQLETAGEIDAQGIGGGETSKLYRASSLELGPMTLRDHTFMSTDLSFLKEHLGAEIVGVVGFGLLSACVAEIDSRAPSVALHDPAAFRLAGCEWIPIDLADRIPALKARFEGHEGLFHIDTGANNGVSFSARAVEKWNLLEGRDTQDAKLGGVGGFIAVKNGTLAWFELGGLRQESVPATFPLESKGVLGGDRIDGSLGASVLKPYVLVTDYPHERLAFRPREVPANAR